MAKPSDKSAEVNAVIDAFSKKLFNRSRVASIVGDVCVTCGGPAKVFDDELSAKEFRISGMCQKCQDKTFR